MDYDKRNHKRGVTPFQAFKILLLTGVICVGIVFAGCADFSDNFEAYANPVDSRAGLQSAGSGFADINTVNFQTEDGEGDIKENIEKTDPSKVNDVVQAGKPGFNRLALKGEVIFDMPLTNTGSKNYAGAAFNTLNKLNVLDKAAATGLGGSISGSEMNTEYLGSGNTLNVKTKRESVVNMSDYNGIKNFNVDKSFQGIILANNPADTIRMSPDAANATLIVANDVNTVYAPVKKVKIADGGKITNFYDTSYAIGAVLPENSSSTESENQETPVSVSSNIVLPSKDNSILSVTGQIQRPGQDSPGELFDFNPKEGSAFTYSGSLEQPLRSGERLIVKITANDPKAKLGWAEGETVDYVTGNNGNRPVITKELSESDIGTTGSKELYVKVMSESGAKQQYTIKILWEIQP